MKGFISQKLGASVLLTLAALTLGSGNPVWALPAGGVVQGGTAAIAQDGKQMTITQTTDKAALDWQHFDIGAGETVKFAQPNTTSVALNRVLGAGQSQILGNLEANGRVFLVNPEGVLFGKGSQVSVGGLAASTKDIAPEDFMKGGNQYTFAGNPSAGAIINQGKIQADRGPVLLLANQVENSGTIEAGTAALLANNKTTVTLGGDGTIGYVVDRSTLQSRTLGTAGDYTVTSRDGEQAILNTVLNRDGIITASGIKNKRNQLILDADDSVTVEGGKLSSQGATVYLRSGGTISVSGTIDSQGGNILLRGLEKGAGVETFARKIQVDSGKLDAGDGLIQFHGHENVVTSSETDRSQLKGKNLVFATDTYTDGNAGPESNRIDGDIQAEQDVSFGLVGIAQGIASLSYRPAETNTYNGTLTAGGTVYFVGKRENTINGNLTVKGSVLLNKDPVRLGTGRFYTADNTINGNIQAYQILAAGKSNTINGNLSVKLDTAGGMSGMNGGIILDAKDQTINGEVAVRLKKGDSPVYTAGNLSIGYLPGEEDSSFILGKTGRLINEASLISINFENNKGLSAGTVDIQGTVEAGTGLEVKARDSRSSGTIRAGGQENGGNFEGGITWTGNQFDLASLETVRNIKLRMDHEDGISNFSVGNFQANGSISIENAYAGRNTEKKQYQVAFKDGGKWTAGEKISFAGGMDLTGGNLEAGGNVYLVSSQADQVSRVDADILAKGRISMAYDSDGSLEIDTTHNRTWTANRITGSFYGGSFISFSGDGTQYFRTGDFMAGSMYAVDGSRPSLVLTGSQDPRLPTDAPEVYFEHIGSEGRRLQDVTIDGKNIQFDSMETTGDLSVHASKVLQMLTTHYPQTPLIRKISSTGGNVVLAGEGTVSLHDDATLEVSPQNHWTLFAGNFYWEDPAAPRIHADFNPGKIISDKEALWRTSWTEANGTGALNDGTLASSGTLLRDGAGHLYEDRDAVNRFVFGETPTVSFMGTVEKEFGDGVDVGEGLSRRDLGNGTAGSWYTYEGSYAGTNYKATRLEPEAVDDTWSEGFAAGAPAGSYRIYFRPDSMETDPASGETAYYYKGHKIQSAFSMSGEEVVPVQGDIPVWQVKVTGRGATLVMDDAHTTVGTPFDPASYQVKEIRLDHPETFDLKKADGSDYTDRELLDLIQDGFGDNPAEPLDFNETLRFYADNDEGYQSGSQKAYLERLKGKLMGFNLDPDSYTTEGRYKNAIGLDHQGLWGAMEKTSEEPGWDEEKGIRYQDYRFFRPADKEAYRIDKDLTPSRYWWSSDSPEVGKNWLLSVVYGDAVVDPAPPEPVKPEPPTPVEPERPTEPVRPEMPRIPEKPKLEYRPVENLPGQGEIRNEGIRKAEEWRKGDKQHG